MAMTLVKPWAPSSIGSLNEGMELLYASYEGGEIGLTALANSIVDVLQAMDFLDMWIKSVLCGIEAGGSISFDILVFDPFYVLLVQ